MENQMAGMATGVMWTLLVAWVVADEWVSCGPRKRSNDQVSVNWSMSTLVMMSTMRDG